MSTIVGTNIEVTNIKYDSDTTSMIISNAGQVTIQGEGTATTNLQQGLAKTFIAMGSDASTLSSQSLNVSSTVDDTGGMTVNFNNNFGQTDYLWAWTGGADGGNNGADSRKRTTGSGSGSIKYISTYNDNTLYDWGLQSNTFFGDLA
tara:strand:- start:434 stop:874 length:441 start_codon:yes stop_codon:yes gene_type:complete